jgi:hypothetical protein
MVGRGWAFLWPILLTSLSRRQQKPDPRGERKEAKKKKIGGKSADDAKTGTRVRGGQKGPSADLIPLLSDLGKQRSKS